MLHNRNGWRRAASVLAAGLAAFTLGMLSGCTSTTVEDKQPDTTVVTPPSGGTDTEVVPVPVPGPAGPAGAPGAPGASGPAGPAGAPGGGSGH